MANDRIRFGEFELEPARRRLRRAGETVPLAGKPMELLLVLVEHRNRVVPRQELLDRVWPDVVVEEANLTQTVSVLRKTLGEAPGANDYLVTVPGVGYRFVGSVVEPPTANPASRARRIGAGRIALLGAALVLVVAAVLVFLEMTDAPPKRPLPPIRPGSVAVLPFQTAGFGEPATDEGVALADAVIRRLGDAGFDVWPTGDVLEFRNPRADTPAEAGRQLGAELVVSGATRRGEGSVALVAQLVRSRDGALLASPEARIEEEPGASIDRLADAIAAPLGEPIRAAGGSGAGVETPE